MSVVTLMSHLLLPMVSQPSDRAPGGVTWTGVY
jgi:hypothetical protein